MTKSSKVAGAGGVVFNHQGEVLVLGHRDGSWVFPKGHVDPGETLQEAALREVEEESGVKARIDSAAQKEQTRYTNAKGQKREITWFLMHTQTRTPVLREETFPDGAFLAPPRALEKLSFKEDRRLLNVMLEQKVGQ